MARRARLHASNAIIEYRLSRPHCHQDTSDRLRGPRRAAVVTASYGGVDRTLRPQVAQDIPVDWIVFTDDKELAAPPPWKVVHAPARFSHPALAAKVHKMVPAVDVTDVVWIDARLQVTSRSFVREALAARHDGVAVFTHLRRDCVFDEAAALLGPESKGGRYADQPIAQQVTAYRAEGYPAHSGLYACGVVAWDLANPLAAELGTAWLAECERWSWRDQVSFPVVCRRLGVRPGVFPLRIEEGSGRGFFNNQWFRIWRHSFAGQPSASTSRS